MVALRELFIVLASTSEVGAKNETVGGRWQRAVLLEYLALSAAPH